MREPHVPVLAVDLVRADQETGESQGARARCVHRLLLLERLPVRPSAGGTPALALSPSPVASLASSSHLRLYNRCEIGISSRRWVTGLLLGNRSLYVWRVTIRIGALGSAWRGLIRVGAAPSDDGVLPDSPTLAGCLGARGLLHDVARRFGHSSRPDHAEPLFHARYGSATVPVSHCNTDINSMLVLSLLPPTGK